MPATALTAIAPLEMVFSGKNKQPVFPIKVLILAC